MSLRERSFVPANARAVRRSRKFACVFFPGTLLAYLLTATSALCMSSTPEKDPAEVTRLYLSTYLNGDTDSARELHAYLHGNTAEFESSDEYRTVRAKQDMLSRMRDLPLTDIALQDWTFPDGDGGGQLEPSLRRVLEQTARLLFEASCDISGHRIDHMPGKPPMASVAFRCLFPQAPPLSDAPVATARELAAILDRCAASMTRETGQREWNFSFTLRQSADGRWRSEDAADYLLGRLALSSREAFDTTSGDVRGPPEADAKSP